MKMGYTSDISREQFEQIRDSIGVVREEAKPS